MKCNASNANVDPSLMYCRHVLLVPAPLLGHFLPGKAFGLPWCGGQVTSRALLVVKVLFWFLKGSYIYNLIEVLALISAGRVGAMASKEAPSAKNFSYVEPCVRHWEMHRVLRRRALKMQRLVANADPDTVTIPPSLANIKHNYEVLKGYTSHMAKTGVILTVPMKYLRPPILEFYNVMEVPLSDETARTFCHGTALIIKKCST